MLRVALQYLAFLAGAVTIAYAAYVTVSWYRFGHVSGAQSSDPLAERFMPSYDVREEHFVRVNASAATTMESARTVSLNDAPVIRAIFKGRELLLRTKPDTARRPGSFVEFAQSLGWSLLAQIPGREMVFGAVTQPWEPNVVFRGLPAAGFASFHDPNYVKILWTLRADPIDASTSVFRTETRAVATDAQAHERFRRYWAAFSPGIVLIRLAALPLIKADAERRMHHESGMDR